MKAGDTVSWEGANRVVSGTLDREHVAGDWIVRLDNGKYVIVNEEQFL